MSDLMPGVGLDIGTMNIVSARKTSTGKVVHSTIRDAFFSLPLEHKTMLQVGKHPYLESGDELILLGDSALKTANMLGKPLKRPLQGGVISSSEQDALPILKLLIQNVLGDPLEPGEVCVYSIPANPVDDTTVTNVYHTAMFENILYDLGYTPIASNEATAIVYSEGVEDQFSAIALSYGSGMTNVSLTHEILPLVEFSVKRGGDWIDENVAKAINRPQTQVCMVKESGVDLMAPQGREQEALVVFYRNLIIYTIDQLTRQIKAQGSDIHLDKPIPIIVGGGTSKAGNFLALFQEVFNTRFAKRFPFEVKEIRAARSALNCVSEGLLVRAIQEQNA